jgi:hypothetical protein
VKLHTHFVNLALLLSLTLCFAIPITIIQSPSEVKSPRLPSPRSHGSASILQKPVFACQSLHIRISSEHRNAPRHPAHPTIRCRPETCPATPRLAARRGVVMASAPARHLRQTWVPLGSPSPSAAAPARPPAPQEYPMCRHVRATPRKAWGFASPPHWTFGSVSVGIGLKLIDPSRRQSNPATPSPNTPHRTKAEPQNPRCTRDKAIQKRKKPRRFLVRA